MQAIHENKVALEANLGQVWEFITELEQRRMWQLHISDGKLLYGKPGFKGAKTQLVFDNHPDPIIEHVKRGDTHIRLKLRYQISEQRYVQVYNLSKINENRTSLLYFCQRDASKSWLKLLNKTPAVPAFLDKNNVAMDLERLGKLLLLEAKAL